MAVVGQLRCRKRPGAGRDIGLGDGSLARDTVEGGGGVLVVLGRQAHVMHAQLAAVVVGHLTHQRELRLCTAGIAHGTGGLIAPGERDAGATDRRLAIDHALPGADGVARQGWGGQGIGAGHDVRAGDRGAAAGTLHRERRIARSLGRQRDLAQLGLATMGVVDAGLQREPGFLARFGEVVAGGVLVARQRDAGNAAAVGGGLTALFAGMRRTRQAVCTVGRDTRERVGAAGHPGKAHERRAAAVGIGKHGVGRAHGKAVLALGIAAGRERDGPTLGVLTLQAHALVGQGGIVMVEGAVLVTVDVDPAGQAVEGLRADAHVQVGAGIGVEQVAARIEGAGPGVVGKDVAGLGDERIARHLDADLVGLARAQTRERGLGADGRGLADVGRAAGLAELGGLAPAGAAAGQGVAGVTRVVVDLGRRTVGVVDAHARVDGRGLDGLQVVGTGIEARGRVAAIERARDIGRAIAHEGQDVDHVGDVDLPKRLAQGIEGDVVVEGFARLDLLLGDTLLQDEAGGRVDGDGGLGRLGAGLEAAAGGIELAVRVGIGCTAAGHGQVAQGGAIAQRQRQACAEGDVGQEGAAFHVTAHVWGDVRVGPGQAGETLRGGVLFHLGLDGSAALAAAGGHIAHAARQHVGDGDGAGVGRQHGGVARLQLEGECGAGSHGLGGVGRLDDLLGDAGGGARLGDL